MRRKHKNEGSARRDSAPHLGAVTSEGEEHTDSNHSTTMARSLGSSMARGLGILLIMMTLSEIAATRARPVYNTNSSPIPMERRHRARRPPFKTRAGRRRRAAATPGTSGGSAAAAILEMRRRISLRNTQAPNLMKMIGPFILLLPAFVPSSRRSGLVPTTSRTPMLPQ